jgi:hypothetical protein
MVCIKEMQKLLSKETKAAVMIPFFIMETNWNWIS